MKSWSLKSIFVCQSSAQKPEWGEGRSQHVYLIALFYIHIHVRPLPGWCVVKKPKVLIPTHYSALVNPNCCCWWTDRKKTDGKELPSCILSFHFVGTSLRHSCTAAVGSHPFFDLSYTYCILRPNLVRVAFTVRQGSMKKEKNKYVRSDRL